MHSTVTLVLLCLPTVIPLASVLVSSPFDNFRIECPQSSGAQRLAIRMVESQGQRRQDTVFVLSCQHILELYPWPELPQEIADQEHEDCRYTHQFDILLDQKLDVTCKEREYLAGITRLADTRIQLECCRMRTRAETGCVQLEYAKPLGGIGARAEIEYQAKLINAISIDGGTIRVRFCDLSSRPIDDIMDELAKTTTTRHPTTARPNTFGWWQTSSTQFAWSPNDQEVPAHPILNHPKLRRKNNWPTTAEDNHFNTIVPIPGAPIPLQKAHPTMAPQTQTMTLVPHASVTEEYTNNDSDDDEQLLAVPEEIVHVDELGTPQRVPIRIAQHQQHNNQPPQLQQNGGVPQQVISVLPLPLTPLQWKFGQNLTKTTTAQFDDAEKQRQNLSKTTTAQFDAEKQQQHQQQHWEEGTGVDPFHGGGGDAEQQEKMPKNNANAHPSTITTTTQNGSDQRRMPTDQSDQIGPTENNGQTTKAPVPNRNNTKPSNGTNYNEATTTTTTGHQMNNDHYHHHHHHLLQTVSAKSQMDSLRVSLGAHGKQREVVDQHQENVDDPFHDNQTVTATQHQNVTVVKGEQKGGTTKMRKKLANSSANENDDDDEDDNDDSDSDTEEEGDNESDQVDQQQKGNEKGSDINKKANGNGTRNQTDDQQRSTDKHEKEEVEEGTQKNENREANNLLGSDQSDQANQQRPEDQSDQENLLRSEQKKPNEQSNHVNQFANDQSADQTSQPLSEQQKIKSDNVTHQDQTVHGQNGDNKKQRNRSDLSFHVIKGFSTRGSSKGSNPRSSFLLIRRKGQRELTVTLLPPKVGQPIGPRISADRERQMAEIAIQERVDLIRKIEKGIQLDTNTEAPFPQWVIPLMSGKMVTLNLTENNTTTTADATKQQQQQNGDDRAIDGKQKNEIVSTMVVDDSRRVQAVTAEQHVAKQQQQLEQDEKKGSHSEERQQHDAQPIQAEQQQQQTKQTQRVQAVQQPTEEPQQHDAQPIQAEQQQQQTKQTQRVQAVQQPSVEQQRQQPEASQPIQAEQQQETTQTQRVQAVQQPSVEQQRQQHAMDDEAKSKDSMHQILFGEPAKPSTVHNQMKMTKDRAEQKPNFNVVHSLLWPTKKNDENDDETGGKTDAGRGKQQKQPEQQQQQQQQEAQEESKNQNDDQMKDLLSVEHVDAKNINDKLLNDSRQDGAVPGEQHLDDDKEAAKVQHRNPVAQQQQQQADAFDLRQNQTNAREQDGAVPGEQHLDDDNNANSATIGEVKGNNQFGQQQQNHTAGQEAEEEQQTATDQLNLVMSMSGMIRKPTRRLNIQQIVENGTALRQTSLENKKPQQSQAPIVAHGVKLHQGNNEKQQSEESRRNVEPIMFPMGDDNEKRLAQTKKWQEDYIRSSREFAESMISAIERHMAETVHGIEINPDRNGKNEDKSDDPKKLEQKQDDQSEAENAGTITVFSKFNNKPLTVSNGSKEQVKKDVSLSTANEMQNQQSDAAKAAEMQAKKSAEAKPIAHEALRQIQIDGAHRRRLIMLRDDVGEVTKRRKNDKKRRRRRKKTQRNDGPQNHQPITTEDIFGTGAVNLPKTEPSNPTKELSEEAILDEEVPPAPADLPPFDAFPSPPPTSSQRRNAQIGMQLAQLPDYGKTDKNATKKDGRIKPTKTTTASTTKTTAELPSGEDDHRHIVEEEEEGTTNDQVSKSTTEVPTSKLPSSRKASRRQFERPSQNGHEQWQKPPAHRVFPFRRGQTAQISASAGGKLGGGLPDEETDSSPFDAETVARVRHSKQGTAEEQQNDQQTTSKNEEAENGGAQTIASITTTTTTTTIPPTREQIYANNRHQIKVGRIESHFDAKSPFEKEIRRKPIVDVSFPKQQQQSNGDDVAENGGSNEKHNDGEKRTKDHHDIMQKDGQPLFTPPFNRPMPMPDGKGTAAAAADDQMPNIGETNDFRTEEEEVEQSLVPMDDDGAEGAIVALKTMPEDKEGTKNEIEHISPIASTTTTTTTTTPTVSSTLTSSIIMSAAEEQKTWHPQRIRSNRRRISTTTTVSTTSNPAAAAAEVSSANGEEFWLSTRRSTVTAPYVPHHVTPYDIAKFYRMPTGNGRQRETVLTFCSKRAAIRDSANMVIACAGEDGEIWTPLRCPPGTDCLPAADSTFKICCPVAIGKR